MNVQVKMINIEYIQKTSVERFSVDEIFIISWYKTTSVFSELNDKVTIPGEFPSLTPFSYRSKSLTNCGWAEK